jgi:hypothetical protein
MAVPWIRASEDCGHTEFTQLIEQGVLIAPSLFKSAIGVPRRILGASLEFTRLARKRIDNHFSWRRIFDVKPDTI